MIALTGPLEPFANSEIERGCLQQPARTGLWYPEGTKTSACIRRLPTIPLWPLGDIVLDVLHLFGPAHFIAAERFQTAVTGKLVEAGLGEHQ